MSLNVELLEKSFDLIRPQAKEFSASFYFKLFQANPEVEALFENTNIDKQQKKLISSLALIVENLRNPESLEAALKSLGAYHVTTGTLDRYYPLVGKALLDTFKVYLGQQWTPELAKTWLDAYNAICELMLQGAANPEIYVETGLSFYEWLDLYGESSPFVREAIATMTNFQYGNGN